MTKCKNCGVEGSTEPNTGRLYHGGDGKWSWYCDKPRPGSRLHHFEPEPEVK